ncbi:phosphopyruvate hydratase, partial [mine drainage metagenome]
FFEKGKYVYRDGPKTVDQQKDFVASLVNEHGFSIVEDPLVDSDYDGFADITARIGKRALIIGDDLYTTNPERIKVGIEKRSTNAALIKVNQIGTLSKTVDAVNLVNRAGWKTVISHRSGETTDDFIAHLGVAFGSEMIKSGTIGGERLDKNLTNLSGYKKIFDPLHNRTWP